MKNLEQQHEVVKTSLTKFIKEHIPTANMKNIDDIVLQYVISILEEASQDESFDVEGETSSSTVLNIWWQFFSNCVVCFCVSCPFAAFQEIMSAYFEEFANIEAAVICTWIFQLESKLSEFGDKKGAEKPAALTLEWVDEFSAF